MLAKTRIDKQSCRGGLLAVDKPSGMTSHDVVATIRSHVRPLKVGHTGTLDPIASGLLILCLGEATKIAGFIEGRHKGYRAVMLLGTRTDTQDVTGEIVARSPTESITEHEIHEVARSFVGRIEQRPPVFSAIKIGGVHAYELARRRENVQLQPRQVEIVRLEIKHVRLPRVDLLVECSKGTYIRTLCHDVGEALGVGGCLESLRRHEIGHFKLADARPLAELNEREVIIRALLPTAEALTHMPSVSCDIEQAQQLAHGMPVTVGEQVAPPELEGSWARALGPDGELIAVGKLSRKDSGVLFYPKRVLACEQGQ